MYRTHTCGQLRIEDAGKSVCLSGWVQKVRKLSVSGNVRRAEQSAHEHRMILEAIRSRNPDLAEQLAKEHIANTIHNIQKTGIYHINQEESETWKKSK